MVGVADRPLFGNLTKTLLGRRVGFFFLKNHTVLVLITLVVAFVFADGFPVAAAFAAVYMADALLACRRCCLPPPLPLPLPPPLPLLLFCCCSFSLRARYMRLRRNCRLENRGETSPSFFSSSALLAS